MNASSLRSLFGCLLVTALPWPSLAQRANEPVAGAQGGTAGPEVVIALEEFVVQTTRDVGYFSSNTAALRLNTPIKELPMSISVLNQEYFEDVNRNDIDELLIFSASVNPDQTASNISFYIRGMPAGTGEGGNRNNTRITGFQDTAGVERIEILKGPAGLIQGISQPGGSVNVIGMRAKLRNEQRVGFQTGSYDSYRALFDTNRVFGRTFAARLNYQWRQDGALLRNRYDRTKTWNFNAIWHPWTRTELELDVQHVRRDEMAGLGSISALSTAVVNNNTANMGRVPLLVLWDLPRDFNVLDRSTVNMRNHTLPTLTWRQSWTDSLKTSYLLNHQWRSQGGVHRQLALNTNNRTLPTNWLSSRGNETRNWNHQFQAVCDFEIGPVKNKLSGYFAYSETYNDFYRWEDALMGPDGQPLLEPNGNPRRNDVVYPVTADLVISRPANLNLVRFRQLRHDNFYNIVGNVVHQGEVATPAGRFLTLLGINRTGTGANGPEPGVMGYNNTPGNSAKQFRATNYHNLPSGGVVFSPRGNVQIWAAKIQSIPGLGLTRDSFNEILPLRRAENEEVGLRLQLLDERIFLTATYFDLNEVNRPVTDPTRIRANSQDVNGRLATDPGFDRNNLAPNSPLGDLVPSGIFGSRGLELEAIIAWGRTLTLRAEYAYIDAAVRRDTDPTLVGQRDNGAVEHAFTFVGRYTVNSGPLKGLYVGPALRVSSERYNRIAMGNVLGTLEIPHPGMRRVDLFGGYRFNLGDRRDLRIQLNVDNVLRDKRYVGVQPGVLRPYEFRNPTTWRLSADLFF
jgi:iron complex outermembrane receptor protein